MIYTDGKPTIAWHDPLRSALHKLNTAENGQSTAALTAEEATAILNRVTTQR